jgi:hypothetical protein
LIVRIGLIPAAPTLVSTPNPATACVAGLGSSAVTLQASGAATTYQWRKGTEIITGVVGNTLSLNADGDDGAYTVRAVNSITGSSVTCQSAPSNVVNVLIYSKPLAPVITVSGSPVVCVGSPNVVLSTENAGAGFRYQWRKNGMDESITTSPSLQVPANVPSAAANYTVAVVAPAPASCLGDESLPVTVTINPLPLKPAITVVGLDNDKCFGETVSLRGPDLGPGLSYEWVNQAAPSVVLYTTQQIDLTSVQTQSYQLRINITGFSTCNSPLSDAQGAKHQAGDHLSQASDQ